MKENIETKDVQRTEYLDKNGLDMLWAKVKENTHNQVEVERNRAVAKENSIIDTKADKSALDNYVLSTALAEYAKKTDIPEVDTSDFVSKTTTDAQAINSTLSLHDALYISSSDDSSSDGEQHNVILNPEALQIMTGDLEGGDLVGVQITSAGRDPFIRLTDSAYTNTLKITREGIHSTDNDANHVYATNGSIADLTQYALSSTLAALEQKVTANTTAISAKQDAGKYIPYEKTLNMNTYVLPDDWSIESRVDVGEGKYNSSRISAQSVYVKSASGKYISIGSENIRVDSGGNASNDRYLLLAPTYITVFDKRNSELFLLDQYGIRLEGGDNNHVLTSNRSTINITEYAKKTELPTVPTKVSQLQNDSEFITKSVYDEKIAALEARIAALEAKHTETA